VAITTRRMIMIIRMAQGIPAASILDARDKTIVIHMAQEIPPNLDQVVAKEEIKGATMMILQETLADLGQAIARETMIPTEAPVVGTMIHIKKTFCLFSLSQGQLDEIVQAK